MAAWIHWLEKLMGTKYKIIIAFWHIVLNHILCVNPVYTEAKNPIVSLSRLRVEENSDYTEITEVVQPVIELLVYSELAHVSKKPKVMFFANRDLVRPFIYYRKFDTLLTTRTPVCYLNSEKNCMELYLCPF